LRDNDSDSYVLINGKDHGTIEVSGQVGGSHQVEYAKVSFITDQTVLTSFANELRKIIDK